MYEPIPTWTLGDRLRKIRRDNADGITQKAFAESIGVGGPAYTAWEGDRSFPREPDDLAERITYGMNQEKFGESIAFSGAAVAKWERMDHTPRSGRRIINAVELRFGPEAARFLRDPQPTGCRPRHLSLVPQLSEVA